MKTYNSDRNTWKNSVRDSNLTGQEKHVAIILESYVNSQTGKCFPAIDTMAAQWSMSRDYIRRHIKSLATKGFIKIDKVYHGKVPSNHYLLMLPQSISKITNASSKHQWDSNQVTDAFSASTDAFSASTDASRKHVTLEVTSVTNPINNTIGFCLECGAPKGKCEHTKEIA